MPPFHVKIPVPQIVRPRSAIIIVDVQNDFITGSLSISNCPAGQNGEDVSSHMMIMMMIMIMIRMMMIMMMIMVMMIIIVCFRL